MTKSILGALLIAVLAIVVPGCVHTPENPNTTKFNEFVEKYRQDQTPHKACALAYDSQDSWSFGSAWARASIAEAVNSALERCETNRLSLGVKDPCRMYFENDNFVYQPKKPVPSSKTETEPPPRTDTRKIRKYGTGFAVSEDGFILTAYHVLDEGNDVRVRFHEGGVYPAEVVKTSRRLDVALLRIKAKTLQFLELAEPDSMKPGDRVFTYGYPAVDILGSEPKFAEGTINSLTGWREWREEAAFFQISVTVQPGNSGGPLVNEEGKVVGIVTATAAIKPFFAKTGTLPQNVNWAVNADFARPLWSRLERQWAYYKNETG